MTETCETCRFGSVMEKWRKQARGKPHDVIICSRMPMQVLKLPDDFCGEHQPQEKE